MPGPARDTAAPGRAGIVGDDASAVDPGADRPDPDAGPAGVVGVVVGDCPHRIWGMTSAERLTRAFARAGIDRVATWHDAGTAIPVGTARHVLFRADHVVDEVLVGGLAGVSGTVLLGPDGTPVAASVDGADVQAAHAVLTGAAPVPSKFRTVDATTLASAYRQALRKREAPFVLPLAAGTVRAIEERMFAGSYKGVTDLVTRYAWPAPALRVTRLCARAGISPNAVTLVSLVMVVLAFWAFLEGWFLVGLAAAWAMTFLDTVDGKLARVTLTSTRFGNVFDHGIDLVHPPFWYWAWAVGLERAGQALDSAGLILAVVIGGYVLQRLQEGLFIGAFGIEMHVWRRFDSRFRLITARRNPNLLLLTAGALIGRPDLGLLWVAAWTAACFLVHTVQIAQAAVARRRGPLASWLAG